MQINQYINRKNFLGCLAILQCIFPVAAVANVDADCPRAKAQAADGMQVEFGQHRFAEGADLAMSVQMGNGMDIKRVTHGGGEAAGCLYQSVAIAPGGGQDQWGWHLAWAGNQGVHYARMDGEAWVSSPPKRLSRSGAGTVQLQVSGHELRLRWHEQQGDGTVVYQAVSHDEGRSWEQSQQLQPAD